MLRTMYVLKSANECPHWVSPCYLVVELLGLRNTANPKILLQELYATSYLHTLGKNARNIRTKPP